MTRDEAIELIVGDGWFGPTEVAAKWVDIYSGLGMLTFDKEPITLCGEDPDWNWWLAQPPEFKAAAVKQIRSRPAPDNGEGVFAKLGEACCGVPYLATTIQKTLDAAGLKIVEK